MPKVKYVVIIGTTVSTLFEANCIARANFPGTARIVPVARPAVCPRGRADVEFLSRRIFGASQPCTPGAQKGAPPIFAACRRLAPCRAVCRGDRAPACAHGGRPDAGSRCSLGSGRRRAHAKITAASNAESDLCFRCVAILRLPQLKEIDPARKNRDSRITFP